MRIFPPSTDWQNGRRGIGGHSVEPFRTHWRCLRCQKHRSLLERRVEVIQVWIQPPAMSSAISEPSTLAPIIEASIQYSASAAESDLKVSAPPDTREVHRRTGIRGCNETGAKKGRSPAFLTSNCLRCLEIVDVEMQPVGHKYAHSYGPASCPRPCPWSISHRIFLPGPENIDVPLILLDPFGRTETLPSGNSNSLRNRSMSGRSQAPRYLPILCVSAIRCAKSQEGSRC